MSEIFRSGEHLARVLNEALKPSGVSFTQYSALRILEGEKEGLPSTAIGEKMVTRDSDVTRLVDRLVKRGLVERQRESEDRRVIRVRLTPAGVDLVERADQLALDLTKQSFGDIKQKRIRRLIEVLQQIQKPQK